MREMPGAQIAGNATFYMRIDNIGLRKGTMQPTFRWLLYYNYQSDSLNIFLLHYYFLKRNVSEPIDTITSFVQITISSPLFVYVI
jgi:hypothetical protein